MYIKGGDVMAVIRDDSRLDGAGRFRRKGTGSSIKFTHSHILILRSLGGAFFKHTVIG